MICGDAGRILFAGDSGMGPHWQDIRTRLDAPDVALLPIGAYEPRWFMAAVHMNPAEAVQAHIALGARRSVGMHFGTFKLTDERSTRRYTPSSRRGARPESILPLSTPWDRARRGCFPSAPRTCVRRRLSGFLAVVALPLPD